MSIPNRLYNIARAQLGTALDRWNDIDARAQQEIDQFLAAHADTSSQPAWNRALSRINAAHAAAELSPAPLPDPGREAALRDSLDATERGLAERSSDTARGGSPAPAPTSPLTLASAYKMLGVPAGADWLSVQSAYNSLVERAAPERFPQGSAEQEAARSIRRRVEAAYILIAQTIAPANNRFDRLEL